MRHKQVALVNLPVGAEFWWGAYKIEDCNWGRKRSTRTLEYRPRILGQLTDHTYTSYFRKHESVYVEC